jgi:hypothetical protein
VFTNNIYLFQQHTHKISIAGYFAYIYIFINLQSENICVINKSPHASQNHPKAEQNQNILINEITKEQNNEVFIT